jgi:hypothetical protein
MKIDLYRKTNVVSLSHEFYWQIAATIGLQVVSIGFKYIRQKLVTACLRGDANERQRARLGTNYISQRGRSVLFFAL